MGHRRRRSRGGAAQRSGGSAFTPTLQSRRARPPLTPADIRLTGELAALCTSVLWSFTATFFSRASGLVGPVTVNRTRLLIAVFLLTTAHRLTLGTWLPAHAEPFRWGWLALSGILGLALGDAALFRAFLTLGPRLAMLMMSLAPVMVTLAGWLLFRETLSGLELAGISLTILGTAWVVTERRPQSLAAPPTSVEGIGPFAHDHAVAVSVSSPGHDRFSVGLAFGLLAAIGQAAGVVTSRMGLVGDFHTISATLMRALAAAAAIWVMAAFRGSARDTVRAWRHRRALAFIAMGSVVGPFLGVWLSLIAVQRAPVGVASTLMALPPIFLIGLEYALFGTRVTRRAIAGTLAAFAGVAAIFAG